MKRQGKWVPIFLTKKTAAQLAVLIHLANEGGNARGTDHSPKIFLTDLVSNTIEERYTSVSCVMGLQLR